MALPTLLSNAPIESALAQMRQLRQSAGMADADQASALNGDAASVNFSHAMKQSLARISQTQNKAYSQAQAFEMGTPGVTLNDVMVDLQKASINFQMGVQVRNKLVAAYQEVMNMTP